MRPENRIRLRTRIIEFLNSKEALGCKVFAGAPPGAHKAYGKRAERLFPRLITGTAGSGKAVALYPYIHNREMLPISICQFLIDVEERGGISGTVRNLGDSFEVLVDNSEEYPRKKQTMLHRYWAQRYKEKENGETT